MEHPRTTKNVGQPCVICGQPANAQATVEALQKKHDDLLGKYRQLVDFYDKHNGTPCEQIRHQQQVEALQRVRDEFERERDQLHAALMEAVLLRDHNLRRCDVLDSKYKKGLAAVKVLQSQLSQLQALVRAYLEARKSIDSDLAEQARENLKHALGATTPAVCPDCDGDGAVDSGGTDPNGNPLMRRCGCREKGGDGEPAECTNHFTDGSKIFPSRNCCSKGAK